MQGQLSQGHCNFLMSLGPEPRSLTPHSVLILKGKGQYFLTVAPRSEMPKPDDVCSWSGRLALLCGEKWLCQSCPRAGREGGSEGAAGSQVCHCQCSRSTQVTSGNTNSQAWDTGLMEDFRCPGSHEGWGAAYRAPFPLKHLKFYTSFTHKMYCTNRASIKQVLIVLVERKTVEYINNRENYTFFFLIKKSYMYQMRPS